MDSKSMWTLRDEALLSREVEPDRLRALWRVRTRCFCGAHAPAPLALLLAYIARLPASAPPDPEEVLA
jgi:hypothetical protein